LNAVREKLESWRQMARVTPLAEVIWQVYQETGLPSFALALPDGKIRKANLLKLHERAIQFDRFSTSQGFVSLGRFVEFVEKLQGTGAEWGTSEPEGLAQDAVRIQSIHKSKGLEFPVVILAELDAEFNRSDFKEDVLCDPQDLLGLQVADPRGAKTASMEHQVIASRLAGRDLAEEMRILYVATTRARQRLILTGVLAGRQCRDALLLGLAAADRAAAATWVGQFKTPLHWILFGCCNRPEILQAFQVAGTGEQAARAVGTTVNAYGQAEAEGLSGYVQGLRQAARQTLSPLSRQGPAPSGKSLALLQAGLRWRYPHEQARACPAKRTVTAWVHQEQGSDIGGQGLELGVTLGERLSARERSDALLVGTATHLVLSCVPLDGPVTESRVRQTLDQLVEGGAIPPSVAGEVNTGSVVGFFASPLGRSVLDPRHRVYREWPFTLRVPARELMGPDLRPQGPGPEEFVVVQGVADLVLLTPEGAVVADFKTDRPEGLLFEARKELYIRQLLLYTQAVQTILGTPVIAKWIYYLANEQAVQVT
jgi:ATP-dependent helicase/nuclease subunit A